MNYKPRPGPFPGVARRKKDEAVHGGSRPHQGRILSQPAQTARSAHGPAPTDHVRDKQGRQSERPASMRKIEGVSDLRPLGMRLESTQILPRYYPDTTIDAGPPGRRSSQAGSTVARPRSPRGRCKRLRHIRRLRQFSGFRSAARAGHRILELRQESRARPKLGRQPA